MKQPTNQVIDETHLGYIVTVDRDAKPKLRKPPRIVSRDELPTDAQLYAVHRELFGGKR